MLNSEKVLFALNDTDETYLESARIRLGYRTEEAVRRPARKRVVAFALAAALILALGAAAYAADLFGMRALFMKNTTSADNPNGGYVSFTQPQDVPEEMDESIRAKIDNSAKAWEEWTVWSRENGIYEPESCKAPEGTKSSTVEENADGTVTIIFYSDGSSENEIERRIVSAEDYEASEAFWEARAKGFSGYDYPYHVYTQAMADKLESIAANYGLKLRHQRTSMFQNHDNVSDFSTREEITARINEVCAGGKSFFRTEPTGYDKFYYFDEGTYAVSFYTTDNLTNTGTSCYLYNSPYGTLSSGYEIRKEVKDIDAFTVRSHTTPDGTELTVLQQDTDMYAYVYLENSFVTLHITQLEGLSEAEIDAVLDMVDFSAIK
ncbi:MAG: hypothetical protein IJH48_08480 [Oscillospiraceae bacterium]|nr:hypothetical protein [Oscillospiraceae bacterium]